MKPLYDTVNTPTSGLGFIFAGGRSGNKKGGALIIMTKQKLNLILRGHVRNAFNDARMYAFVQYLDTLFNLEIYIHTWNIKQVSTSHRLMETVKETITETHFIDYFKELFSKVKWLDIEDDTNIVLVGNLKGRMFPRGGTTPLIGWKYMIHGKYKAISYVKKHTSDSRELVLDTRLDLFPVQDIYTRHYEFDVYKFVRDHSQLSKVKNVFCLDDNKYGVDNVYFGSVDSCFELNNLFHHYLDNLILQPRNKDLINPEFLYARESRALHKRKLLSFVMDIPNIHKYPLNHVFEIMKIQHDPNTLWLEFGTAGGTTINYISQFTPHPVYGFDSFEGLPEDWREGFLKGAFHQNGHLPAVRPNVQLVKGWFSDSLVPFLETHNQQVSFVHIDCDIYSSTTFVLETLRERLAPGCIIVFDELVNYDGFDEDNGELHAFYEFVTKYNLQFKWIGMNGTIPMRGYVHENVAVQLL